MLFLHDYFFLLLSLYHSFFQTKSVVSDSSTMELSLQTFLWLRDKGGLSSQAGVPSQYNNGMMSVSPDGMQDIASGLPLVRVLHHYCCHRFDAPQELLPVFPTNIAASSNAAKGTPQHPFVSLVAARTHNWRVVQTIVKSALDYEIPGDQLDAVQRLGDALEALLIVKVIYDLVRAHRGKEKQSRELHRTLQEDAGAAEVKRLLESKSVAPSKQIKIISTVPQSKGRNSPPPKRYQSPLKSKISVAK
jgi:hypothetical protein